MDKSPEISITEDSQENTPNFGFRFGLKPARRLKIAIEALCDPQFNPTGTGKIEVNGAGFRITARSPYKVLGFLCLKGTGLDNFQCRTPIMGNKLVDLRKISAKLVVDDQDTVTVLQIDGSNQITFMFGENPTQEFTVGLFRNNGQVPRFSNFSRFCETALPSRDMHRLVDELFLKGKPQLVSVSIKKDVVRVVLGTRKISSLTYTRASRDMNFEFTRGLVEPWQRHQGFFFWPYSGVLQKAAGLLPYYFVGFAHSPPNHVILRFSLQEHGNLFFLKEAVQLLTKNIRD